jgi:excisionase family DNA binding protein
MPHLDKQFGPNDVLTTGQVAKICNVAPRTVSKWFDSGQLRGYRIPGSKDRRIPVHHLVRFMRAHGIPLGDLDSGRTRVLLIDDDAELLALLEQALSRSDRYSVRTALGGFEAGATAERFHPHVILVDTSLPDVDPKRLAKFVHTHPELQATRIIATSGALTDAESESLRQCGFDGCLGKPFDVHQVVAAIEDAVAIVY